MSLTKSTAVDQITVTENGIILYREATRIMEDGVVISSTYWRCVLTPNDPTASTVLDEAYYASIATYAWSQPSPQPYDPNPPTSGV